MLILKGVLIGIGANVLFDLWGLLLARLPGTAKPNWAAIGRWFWHLRDGRVVHDDIAKVAPYAHENTLGWIGHYAVAILYGVVFALIVGPGWFADPTLLPAWIFGIITVAAGWFLLQPGLGLGWAASKTPNPAKVRMLNLAGHSVFGIGLYLTARIIA